MCRRRRGGCRMPDWLRDYEARLCSILAILSFSCAVTSFAVFTDSAVLSLTVALKPALCTVISSEELYGLTKCQWTSCRGSCTAMFYNCTQIKVIYALVPENHTSNFSDFDLFDNSNGNVIAFNVNSLKYNLTRSLSHYMNKTNTSSEFEDMEIVKLFDGEETMKKNISRVAQEYKDKQESKDNKSQHFSSGINLPGKYFSNISDAINSAVTETREVRSTNFENENYMSELFKGYDGYNIFNLSTNTSENSSEIIPLYVNIFGCGYEPPELCDQFFTNYTHIGMEFQCLINFGSEIFAVPNPEDYDFTKFKDPMRSLLLSLIPLGVCVFSACYIRVRHLFRMPRNLGNALGKKRKPLTNMEAQEEKNSYTPLIVDSRSVTKMSFHKNGQERLPAFIKVQTSSSTTAEPCQVIDREQFL